MESQEITSKVVKNFTKIRQQAVFNSCFSSQIKLKCKTSLTKKY